MGGQWVMMTGLACFFELGNLFPFNLLEEISVISCNLSSPTGSVRSIAFFPRVSRVRLRA